MDVFGYQRTDVDLELTGRAVDVPKNQCAKLMYYLHCVNSCAPGCVEASLTRYWHYYLLSANQKRKVVSMANQLSPNNLEEVIFLRDESLGQSVTENVKYLNRT